MGEQDSKIWTWHEKEYAGCAQIDIIDAFGIWNIPHKALYIVLRVFVAGVVVEKSVVHNHKHLSRSADHSCHTYCGCSQLQQSSLFLSCLEPQSKTITISLNPQASFAASECPGVVPSSESGSCDCLHEHRFS